MKTHWKVAWPVFVGGQTRYVDAAVCREDLRDRLTTEPGDVTCLACRKKMRRRGLLPD